MRPLRRRTLVVLVGATALAVIAAWWVAERRDGLSELASAVGFSYPLEVRLGGGFIPGSRAIVRGAESPSLDLSPDARISIALIEKRAAATRTVRAMTALGVAHLLRADFDRSIETFESTLHHAPRDAALLADLSAAYLARGSKTDRVEDAAKAITYARSALDSDPKLPEARFNLALALETLGLPGEATLAWEAYLELDGTSPWSAEANRHIAGLVRLSRRDRDAEKRAIAGILARRDAEALRAAVTAIPDTAYDYFLNELIPRWAEASIDHDRAAASMLASQARAVADVLASTGGDRLPVDAAAAVERATREGRSDGLALAHRAFAEGRTLYNADRFNDSLPKFEGARAGLGGSPFELWTTYYAATVAYYRSNLAAAAAPLDALIETSARRQYFLLLGRTFRLRGLLRGLRGEVQQSLDDYERALEAFSGAGAKDDLSAIHSSIAQRLEAVGDYGRAWEHRRQSLADLNSVASPHTILLSTAMLAKRQSLLPTAFAIQSEALAGLLGATSPPDRLAETYLNRADVLHMMGRETEARADAAAAERWASQIEDPDISKRFQAEAWLAEGEFLVAHDPDRALISLESALTYFTSARMDQRLARVYQAEGRAQARRGRASDAEGSFRKGIAILERQRAALPSGGLRLSYFELPWDLFDDLIALQIAQPDGSRSGLATAERARARDLAERASGDASVLNPSELSAQLPPSITVVYYLVLPNEVAAWVIQKQRLDLFRTPISQRTLEADVAAFRAALSTGAVDDFSRLSAVLFDTLVKPVEAVLPAGATIVFVPDGVLHAIPFAALRDSRRGRYLVEDHPLSNSPSVTLFAQSRRRLSLLPPLRDSRAFVVGNPRVDRADGDFSPLTAAEHEARRIATRYPDTVVLTGASATKAAFLERAGTHGIVHFAGHAIANDAYPLLSRLFFARSAPEQPGVLFSHEVLSMNLSKTALVVLAACRTGVGIRKGEGVVGLARPFMAHGVPAVIASLWDVDDRATGELFDVFYELLRAGQSPSDALRTAQLTLLHRDGVMPSAWASFVLNGGVS